ncbi:hypothetical protein DZF91_33115 [Actinomadura logoneensis]|uniref:Uncharacterized protein n=1 Tax=Actinomadura logoneensis TaxID=2293572 RepID=A0A372JBM4_9ACTN|nr:hypothetical protein [Actinomadura logoneensis]RFU37393.1 hypothetical protein DZF91_33115 [Actinomadura logoneensis]
MYDRPASLAAPQGRRVIPEQVHAAAFLAYTLAAAMFGFAVAGSVFTFAEPTGRTFDGTPCYGTTNGVCQKDPSAAPAGMVLALLLLALFTAAAGLAVHFGIQRARPVLVLVAALGGIGGLLLLNAPGAGTKVAAFISAGACVAMARLPYGAAGARYFGGLTPTRAEALTAPDRARPSTAPGSVWLAAAFFTVLTAISLFGALVGLALAPAVFPLAAADAGLMGAVAVGLVRGRSWARAYAITALVLALAGGVAVLVQLGDIASPRHEPFASKPPSVAGGVVLTLVLMTVDALVLWSLASERRAVDFFARGV